jgi:hypothetical protein
MNGGTISGNNAPAGGGIYSLSTINMSGGTISGNTANGSVDGRGGGIYVDNHGGNSTFKKSGGIIYGAGTSSTLKNTANMNGDAIWVYGGNYYPSYVRNTTAGQYVILDITQSGASGGWE